MAKSVFLLFICCLISIPLLSQNTILVDAIHGVDYHILNDQLIDIQFDEIFPDYEITKVTPMDIQWSEMYVDEEVAGDNVYQYSVSITNEIEMPGALYIVVYPLDYRYIWGITGDIIDPQGAVVAELYQGVGHVDLPAEGDWDIELELGLTGNYQVKIGYGELLYDSDQYQGVYNLNDFDVLIRIKNDEAYPFLGKYQEFSETDLTALEEAFDDGLACLNVYNIFNPYVDKPFVHFYADNPVEIDFAIHFNGMKTLTKPEPEIRGNKWQWNDLQLNARSNNELIYEGVYHQPFNFIQFDGTNDFLKLRNQTKYPLDEIYLTRYTGDGYYQFADLSEILPGEKLEVTDIRYYTGKELKKLLKDNLINNAIKYGFSEIEAIDFFSNYNWIETMLHRAYDHEGQWSGIYHFGKDLYDRILPYDVEPNPKKFYRNMWVLLSNIDPNVAVEPVQLCDESELESNIADYRINEYGFIDEYYCLDFDSREDEFFGIDLYQWSMSLAELNMIFYDNEIANEISSGVTNLTSFQFLNFLCDNYEESGILYEEYTPQYPVSAVRNIGNDGRLMMLGTAYTFDNQPNNNQFLRNSVDALLNSQYFTDSNSHQIPGNDRYQLHHYPNPYKASNSLRSNDLTISFNIPENEMMVEIAIFNLKGQKVKVLINKKLIKGEHAVSWDGTDSNGNDVSTGIYFYRLRTEDGDSGGTKKVVKMK